MLIEVMKNEGEIIWIVELPENGLLVMKTAVLMKKKMQEPDLVLMLKIPMCSKYLAVVLNDIQIK